MKLNIELGEKLLRHRRLYVGLIVFLSMVVILSFIFVSWLFLNQLTDNLEEELGERLRSTALSTAQIIEALFDESSKDQLYMYAFQLKEILNRVKEGNQIQSAFLIREDFSVIADDENSLTFPAPRTYVQQDSIALESAWNGVAMPSALHEIEGEYFKSAYAPVINVDQEIMAVVVVEAPVQFFNTLKLYSRGLALLGLVSLIVVALFSIFVYWAISLLLQSYEKMRRSERLALMGQMAASMAHEIRNPLGIMKGTADVLRELYDNPDKPNELFDFIPLEIKRLNRLVNDFLSFARGVNIEKKRGDLKQVLHRVAGDFEREEINIPVEFLTEIDGNLPRIEFDEDAIYRVVYNLALNGIQAMNHEGTLIFRLSHYSKKGDDFQKVEIQDTGCGIEGDLTQIFDPFFTTKTKGTGLGLAISRQIIEKHGGWIEAASESAKGTTMRFYLPA